MVINTNSSSYQHAIVVICIVSSVVSSLLVAIRVWTRTFISHSMGRDDYASLVTLLLCIVYGVLIGLGTNYGFGWHTADMSPDLYVAFNKWNFISSFFYLGALFGYKFSILLLYLRLFSVNKYFRYCTWAVMTFVFGYLFANFLTQLFGCTPIVEHFGHCVLSTRVGLAYGSMNFISDIFIIVLPLPIVWRLQLSRKEKLGVTLIFMSGVIAFIVAAVRYSILVHKLYSTDKLWWDGINLLWMVLEVNSGLTCSCTPALKPVYRYLASNGFFKSLSEGFLSHPKSSIQTGRRSDFGSFAQRKTEGGGFVVLGNTETELEASHT